MLEVRILGQFEILQDGRRLTIPTRHAQALFAYLILNAGKSQRRERLAGVLWPDSSDENARSNLRHELWRLRKTLETDGKSYFRIDDLSIALDPVGEYDLDVKRLENRSIESSSVEDLIEALSIYRGDLLPGFYDEWVEVERERLSALFEAKLSRLVEILQTQERWPEVLDWGNRWIALGGWPEPAYRALMNAYANHGDLSKAAVIYERLTNGLQKDLGISPSNPTQELYHRLKANPKNEVQNVISTLPQLPRARITNLPRPLTSFIGRETEILQVQQLVSGNRLVTITGSGGVGKTRLAIQIGRALLPQYRDGIWWVELAALFRIAQGERSAEINRSDHVTQAVAKVLRVPDAPGRLLLDETLEHLYSRQLLLILDNCEHLIDECAAFVGRVLVECPDVTILATSREVFGSPGEKAWRLPSLSLPREGALSNPDPKIASEAVGLFIERAADVLPGYQPRAADTSIIAQICTRLDGIPLAIELAAARMNLLSAQEIAARLDNRFNLLSDGYRTDLPRHRTLRAAIEWSYDLLSLPEQVLFRRLSVFTGSFTLEAVEATCTGMVIHPPEVLSLMGRLVNKSLLNVEAAQRGGDLPTRYHFLDTIHSFGRLKLEEAGETGLLSDQHAAYYVGLAEAAEPELLLQNQVHWFKLLQAENDNLRAVIEWSVKSDQAEPALRLISALLWFWFSYGSTREGCDLALKALSLPTAAQLVEAHAKALNKTGFLLYLLRDMARARQMLEEAIRIQKGLGDEANLAWSLQFLGLVLAYEKEYDLADTAFQEGLALTRKLKGNFTNNFLHFLGDVYMEKGDQSRARKIYQESVSILREIGSKSFLAYPLRRLGYLALWENDIPEAWAYFQESMTINIEIGDQRAFAASLVSLAALAIRLNKPVAAARLYGVVENLLESLSVNMLNMDQSELRHISIELPRLLDKASFLTAFTEGGEMSEAQAILQAHVLFEN
jgi:predicted ATPase/DNA-binding SARP family transcriptional activator